MTSLPVSEELRLHQFGKKREFDPENYPILLAEDNPDDILITQKAWEVGKIKNKLYVVKNGKEALDFLYMKGKFADAPIPGLLLLDLKMPLVDGFEVLAKIKEDAQLKRMPVIVLTTSKRIEDIQRAYDLGCNSYIVKPVNFENFIYAVVDIQRYWMILCEIPYTSCI
jgi:CheY-like chemotaxis protein